MKEPTTDEMQQYLAEQGCMACGRQTPPCIHDRARAAVAARGIDSGRRTRDPEIWNFKRRAARPATREEE